VILDRLELVEREATTASRDALRANHECDLGVFAGAVLAEVGDDGYRIGHGGCRSLFTCRLG
jgi:hypothetical protein